MCKALDQGLDPNAATKTGGTTALMLAQPDVEKTKLLLDRGTPSACIIRSTAALSRSPISTTMGIHGPTSADTFALSAWKGSSLL